MALQRVIDLVSYSQMQDETKKKILLVEDDSTILKPLNDKLTGLGYDVVHAQTGQQAINRIRSQPPDLVLLDIMLPEGMNGFDVLEYIKKAPNLKSIPVIVLTNLDSEQKSALQIGAADYLIKSNISLDNLVLKIKSYLQ